jgi:hypothetical protein
MIGLTVNAGDNFKNRASIALAPCIYTVKKIYRIPVFFLPNLSETGNHPYADKGFFGALQRRNFLSFEEGKVFLFLQGYFFPLC